MNDNKSLKELGKVLRAARKDLGLTQRQLADCLGCTAQCLSCWETGRFFPSEKFEPLISKDLGILVSKYKAKSQRRMEKSKHADEVPVNTHEEVCVEESPVQGPEEDDVLRIPVYVGRVLRALEEYGYGDVKPTLLMSLLESFAKVLVGRCYYDGALDKELLSVPCLINEDVLGEGNRLYIYSNGDRIECSKDILDFDWGGYLKRSHLEAYLVLKQEEENGFFQE